ncbi:MULTISPECIES: tripartite tricarboxylate transporter substrate binding protein [unclassified Achromobacter]|uniref:Bug family tripartite tricarboxylate transporter substrate binding protein n=1 Tax=unclassified Achromobacter TaxID=2626865 RepID=UPI000B51C572|nr:MULTISPECIES: tripartite tricarboxylate transporter substrate binding protein [unclassified Achromobacter]OWT73725.1 hypothetical protein CEY05_21800 [Achromobacter sp. HZ34]OWT79359.1 hypothetical protein CEY04_10180 [Achromobacter sp. HZ28]
MFEQKDALGGGRRRFLAGLGGVTLMASGLPDGRAAQGAWPTQPLRFVIVFPPGASINAFARLMAEPLAQSLGQSVVVENKDGAGGMIGVASVAHSRGDGYTFCMAHVGTLAVQPAVMGDKMPYQALKDLTPIIHLTDQPNVLVVHESVPAKNLNEFVAWARQKPGTAYATPGVATSNQITGELVSAAFKLGLTHVPYRGVTPAMQDLMGGLIQVAVLNIADAMPLVEAGRARALLVTSEQRSPVLPDAVTIVEAGASPQPLNSWQGIFAPAGVPKEAVAKLNAAFNLALKDEKVRKWLDTVHAVPVGGTTEDFQKYVLQEHAMWADLVHRFKLEQIA